MNSYYAYTFLTGIFIGGYTNLFSKLVISGLVLYIFHPDNFNPRRFAPLYHRICEKTYPYISQVYSLTEPDEIKIVDVTSPLPIKKLPPLKINK